MGTFAETAIVDFCSSFAYKEKQTSIFRFHLQQTKKMEVCCFRLPFAANK
jgi:hypothetical protein